MCIFPIYKALHTKRAFGRVQQLLKETEISEKKGINAKNVFEHLFWNGIDSYRILAGIPSATQRIRIENEFLIEEATQNEPLIAMSIHQGAFEIMHRILCNYNKNVLLVTSPLKSKILTHILHDLRNHQHLKEFNTENVGHVLRDLFKTNGILAMVVDQSKTKKGNVISLFKKKSKLFLRLPLKANQMGAGIITFRTFPNIIFKNGKFIREHIIRFEHYFPPRLSSTEQGKNDLIHAIERDVEKWIEEHPKDWTWNYHRNFEE